MANTLTNILPKMLASGLLVLRQKSIMPALVNASYSDEAAQKGATIDIPLPPSYTVSDVSPSNTPPAPANTSNDLVQLTLSNWKYVDFHLTDKECMEIDRNRHFIPLAAQAAVEALARDINTKIHGGYKQVYGYVGTAGSTPFQSTVNAITDARKVLNTQLAPTNPRRVVLDHTAEANALALAQFSDFERTGDPAVKREGEMGRKFGFDWYNSDAVPTHTAGTWTSATVQTSVGIGVTSIGVEAHSAALELKFGDVFTVAGDTQTYVVTTSTSTSIAASGTATISFAPALKTAPAAGAALTVKASHVVNMGFHRDAFAYAQRPLGMAMADGLGPQIMFMTDPMTGMTLRITASRQHMQTALTYDVLFGTRCIRPELAVRIAG